MTTLPVGFFKWFSYGLLVFHVFNVRLFPQLIDAVDIFKTIPAFFKAILVL